MMVLYFIIGLIFLYLSKERKIILIYFLFNCLYALLGYNVDTIRLYLIFADSDCISVKAINLTLFNYYKDLRNRRSLYFLPFNLFCIIR